MINDANDNYLHPYHGVSLPNDCRSIFTDAVIANYASHDWEVARMCGEQNGLECRDGNFWDSALRGEDWFDYRREGLGHLVWRERRERREIGATPQGSWHLHTRISDREQPIRGLDNKIWPFRGQKNKSWSIRGLTDFNPCARWLGSS